MAASASKFPGISPDNSHCISHSCFFLWRQMAPSFASPCGDPLSPFRDHSLQYSGKMNSGKMNLFFPTTAIQGGGSLTDGGTLYWEWMSSVRLIFRGAYSSDESFGENVFRTCTTVWFVERRLRLATAMFVRFAPFDHKIWSLEPFQRGRLRASCAANALLNKIK
jgi:hypothetical protein